MANSYKEVNNPQQCFIKQMLSLNQGNVKQAKNLNVSNLEQNQETFSPIESCSPSGSSKQNHYQHESVL